MNHADASIICRRQHVKIQKVNNADVSIFVLFLCQDAKTPNCQKEKPGRYGYGQTAAQETIARAPARDRTHGRGRAVGEEERLKC